MHAFMGSFQKKEEKKKGHSIALNRKKTIPCNKFWKSFELIIVIRLKCFMISCHPSMHLSWCWLPRTGLWPNLDPKTPSQLQSCIFVFVRSAKVKSHWHEKLLRPHSKGQKLCYKSCPVGIFLKLKFEFGWPKN